MEIQHSQQIKFCIQCKIMGHPDKHQAHTMISQVDFFQDMKEFQEQLRKDQFFNLMESINFANQKMEFILNKHPQFKNIFESIQKLQSVEYLSCDKSKVDILNQIVRSLPLKYQGNSSIRFDTLKFSQMMENFIRTENYRLEMLFENVQDIINMLDNIEKKQDASKERKKDKEKQQQRVQLVSINDPRATKKEKHHHHHSSHHHHHQSSSNPNKSFEQPQFQTEKQKQRDKEFIKEYERERERERERQKEKEKQNIYKKSFNSPKQKNQYEGFRYHTPVTKAEKENMLENNEGKQNSSKYSLRNRSRENKENQINNSNPHSADTQKVEQKQIKTNKQNKMQIQSDTENSQETDKQKKVENDQKPTTAQDISEFKNEEPINQENMEEENLKKDIEEIQLENVDDTKIPKKNKKKQVKQEQEMVAEINEPETVQEIENQDNPHQPTMENSENIDPNIPTQTQTATPSAQKISAQKNDDSNTHTLQPQTPNSKKEKHNTPSPSYDPSPQADKQNYHYKTIGGKTYVREFLKQTPQTKVAVEKHHYSMQKRIRNDIYDDSDSSSIQISYDDDSNADKKQQGNKIIIKHKKDDICIDDTSGDEGQDGVQIYHEQGIEQQEIQEQDDYESHDRQVQERRAPNSDQEYSEMDEEEEDSYLDYDQDDSDYSQRNRNKRRNLMNRRIQKPIMGKQDSGSKRKYQRFTIPEINKILDAVNELRDEGMSYKDIAPKMNLTVNQLIVMRKKLDADIQKREMRQKRKQQQQQQ